MIVHFVCDVLDYLIRINIEILSFVIYIYIYFLYFNIWLYMFDYTFSVLSRSALACSMPSLYLKAITQ